MIWRRMRSRLHALKPCRLETVKLKINGCCVNRCVFCPFHESPHLLEVADIARLFHLLGKRRLAAIIVNGGEPTLHPRFADIGAFLGQRFKGRVPLILGTNLLPLAGSPTRRAALYAHLLETYDGVEVGCDDEHRNIDAVERFAPDIVSRGLRLQINAMADYCGAATRARILAVRDRCGATVTFSQVHHDYRTQPVVNALAAPCRKRARDLLVNCNGDVFFCYHQELEAPLFNLFRVTPAEWDYYIRRHDPAYYRFCACCPAYEPQRALAAVMQRAGRALDRLTRGRCGRPAGVPQADPWAAISTHAPD
jgi:hypothetical protein